MKFLGFFDNNQKVKTVDAKGNARSFLDTLGDVMAVKLKHESHDRDLVVMKHYFTIEDKNKKRWVHSSTFINSGESAKSGG